MLFELVTRRYELPTHEFELLTHKFELVTQRFEIVTHVLLLHNQNIMKLLNFYHVLLNLVSAIFYQIFIFHQMITFQKL